MNRFWLVAAICAGTAARAAEPFTVGDWWSLRTATDPQITGDGSRVVYVENWNDRGQDAFRSNLWMVTTAGAKARRLTEGSWRDWSPRWSPDGGSVAYVSDRGGRPQIRVHVLESAKDTEVATESTPLGIGWSPDGKSLAFTAEAPRSDPPPDWAPAGLLPHVQRKASSHVQVFVVPAGGGAVRRLTADDLSYEGSPAWTADGRSILLAASGGIYAIRPVDGARQLLSTQPGTAESPVPSGDGSRIAWLVRSKAAQGYSTNKLCVANADGSRTKILAGSLDRDVREPQWSSDSRTVYFLADDHGATYVYAARADGTARQVRREPQRLTGFSLADNGRAAAVRSNATGVGEVVTFPVDVTGEAVRLAAPAAELLAGRQAGAAEPMEFGSDGKTIQAWVLKPPGFETGQQYPLLLDIDDAPRRMCGPELRLRSQILAARGFVVMCANPRGTPGYGEEFGNLIRSRYPGDDFDDLMRGVDAVVAKGYVDAKRVAIAGGLLAAWAIGHTDRFAAAVVRRPVVDWTTQVALTGNGAASMGAMPWEDPEQYTKHSPLYFAGNFRTPTLVLAGERDVQSEELWFALQEKKVESAMVRVSGVRPSGVALEWEATLAWLGRFLASPKGRPGGLPH